MIENVFEQALSYLIDAGCHVHLRQKLRDDNKSERIFLCKITGLDSGGMWFGEGSAVKAATVNCLRQMISRLEESRFEIQRLADENKQLIAAVKAATGEKTNG